MFASYSDKSRFILYASVAIIIIWQSVALILFSNLSGSLNDSAYLNFFLKLIPLTGLLYCFLLNGKFRASRLNIIFIIFCVIYLLKLMWSYLFYEGQLYRSETTIALYFIGFIVLPYITLSSIDISRNEFRKIYNYSIVGGICFSIVSIVFYFDEMMTGKRITFLIERSENFISPFVLSYLSAMIILFLMHNIFIRAESMRRIFVNLALITLMMLPLAFGGSRGAFVLLIIGGLVQIFTSNQVRHHSKPFIKSFAILTISTGIYFTGMSMIDRFSSLIVDLESSSASAERYFMWIDGINQFLRDPLIGRSFELESYGFYPHNIYIESLISVGLIGSFFFFSLILFALVKLKSVIHTERGWVVHLFLTGLIWGAFSGALYTSILLFIGMALIFSAERVKNLE
jgi:hypothetical protein